MWVYLPLLLSALAGDSLGDLITSHGSEKQAQDGNSVTLSCNYTGAVYNLLWYRQYQRSKPELLLSMTESGDPVKADPSAHWLSAKVDKLTKLMELEISPAKVSDSAQYYCALQPTVAGNPFLLHKILPMKPGSKPEFLLLIVESTKTVVPASPLHPHMSIRLRNNNGVDLEISSAAVSDSALYYCALEPTVTEKPTTLYKKFPFLCFFLAQNETEVVPS
ncbi:uncharacterized protein LOC107726895 [Sinocyclocheilus rhinocerous]|uniref:uncharacterized protein LOC107726895 n=1 Tax=Sinocyclocheilus rhinocerous TaxID=307959 RepID=UPI0007B92ECA|nr:PREDICTED: uncharacterized protein LOC107726895 [Sinocyclocheilus rhinocerous]